MSRVPKLRNPMSRVPCEGRGAGRVVGDLTLIRSFPSWRASEPVSVNFRPHRPALPRDINRQSVEGTRLRPLLLLSRLRSQASLPWLLARWALLLGTVTPTPGALGSHALGGGLARAGGRAQGGGHRGHHPRSHSG